MYQVIDLDTEETQGEYGTLDEARGAVRFNRLSVYEIWHNDNVRVEGCSDRGDDFDDDRTMFADPGGNSALRAATRGNPRNLPCPNCGAPNRLTPADRAAGYQCDSCADRDERGGY